MSRGYTLIELIVTIAIMLILGAGAVSAYLFVFKKGAEAPVILKDEMELQLSLAQLLKDVESIGFGLTKNYFNAGNSCTLVDLLSNNQSVSICTASGYELLLLSLSTRNTRDSGCWGYTDKTGCVFINSGTKSVLGFDCPNSGLNPAEYIATDFYKNSTFSCTANSACSSGIQCGEDRLVFYLGSGNAYPDSFAARYFLSNTNLPGDCAPGTFVLEKEHLNDIPQPVISCVHTFRAFYMVQSGTGFSYTTTPPSNIDDLRGIRLCFIVQIGKKRDASLTPPNFSANCGGSASFTAEQRNYRWKVVELDIPVRNLQ